MEWNQLSLIDGMKFSRGRWAPPHNPQTHQLHSAAFHLPSFRFFLCGLLVLRPLSHPNQQLNSNSRLAFLASAALNGIDFAVEEREMVCLVCCLVCLLWAEPWSAAALITHPKSTNTNQTNHSASPAALHASLIN